ncbi:MAG: protein-glutamine gamma-glutamyltransferase [Oscillospiraceae bacterium]|nr:protein-glutamine gamma-glutamyltransferase [Oscillospiraceae bacterium]
MDTINNYADFEENLRREIVNAAESLHESGMSFAVFDKAKCNPDYWNLTSNGGWTLKQGVKPSSAIADIYENGYKYATECATALEIVYYKAILEVYGTDLFDKTFKQIYLMDWDVRDPLLSKIGTLSDLVPPDELQVGDRAYFANPDHSADLPQWQGENVIVLDKDRFYGHGLGISDGEDIISALNGRRKSGSSQSAYLMNKSGRPDFRRLADIMLGQGERAVTVWREFPTAVLAGRAESKNGFVHIHESRMFV